MDLHRAPVVARMWEDRSIAGEDRPYGVQFAGSVRGLTVMSWEGEEGTWLVSRMEWADKLVDSLNADEEFRAFALASLLFLERYYEGEGEGAGKVIEDTNKTVIDRMNQILDEQRKKGTPKLVSHCLIFEGLLAGLVGVLDLMEKDREFKEIRSLMKTVAGEEEARFKIHYR